MYQWLKKNKERITTSLKGKEKTHFSKINEHSQKQLLLACEVNDWERRRGGQNGGNET